MQSLPLANYGEAMRWLGIVGGGVRPQNISCAVACGLVLLLAACGGSSPNVAAPATVGQAAIEQVQERVRRSYLPADVSAIIRLRPARFVGSGVWNQHARPLFLEQISDEPGENRAEARLAIALIQTVLGRIEEIEFGMRVEGEAEPELSPFLLRTDMSRDELSALIGEMEQSDSISEIIEEIEEQPLLLEVTPGVFLYGETDRVRAAAEISRPPDLLIDPALAHAREVFDEDYVVAGIGRVPPGALDGELEINAPYLADLLSVSGFIDVTDAVRIEGVAGYANPQLAQRYAQQGRELIGQVALFAEMLGVGEIVRRTTIQASSGDVVVSTGISPAEVTRLFEFFRTSMRERRQAAAAAAANGTVPGAVPNAGATQHVDEVPPALRPNDPADSPAGTPQNDNAPNPNPGAAPDEGSPGAASGALPRQPTEDAVRAELRRLNNLVSACGNGQDGIIRANFRFESSGTLADLDLSGPSAARLCARQHLQTATMPPFTRSDFNMQFDFRVQ